MTMTDDDVDPMVPPSGTGCAECEAAGGWWLHLRRCALCGHIGCCDTSPSQHATKHAKASGHHVVRSFEPGEDWFWDYDGDLFYDSGPSWRRRSITRPTRAYPARAAVCRTTGSRTCTD